MPVDPDIQRLIDAGAGLPPLREVGVTQARAGYRVASLARQHGREPEPVAEVSNRTVPGPAGEVPVRVYRPEAPAPLPVVVYAHGGGWVLGDLDTHDPHARAVAAKVAAVVVSVGYRLAPEHPFPAALDDLAAVARWALERAGDLGGDPARVAVGGDSAGGNLAAASTLRLRDTPGLPSLAAQLLVYPSVDATLSCPSVTENGAGRWLESGDMRWFLEQYLPTPADRADALASPLSATDLTGLPPAVVAVAGYDPLRDEGIAYAERLGAAGGAVRLLHFPTLTHSFFGLGALSAAAAAAVDETCAALRDLLHPAG